MTDPCKINEVKCKMKNIILGTDWWTDCDDAVAIRLLCRAVKRGEINLLGIAINACMECSVSSLDGFLALEGVTDIPLAIDKNATDFGGIPRYQKRLSQYTVRYKDSEDAEDIVRFYRRLLAAATEPVEIVEIGYLQGFTAFMKSGADDISPKSGLELLREKVSKLWVMAGKWDADGEKENNFCRNARSRVAGEELCRLCPVPVTFLGWEVGYPVITGSKLSEGDHLLDALRDHGSGNGRCSWDPMLVQMALTGDEKQAGYSTVRGTARVDAETGQNYFTRSPDGLHTYVIKDMPDGYYADIIDERIK